MPTALQMVAKAMRLIGALGQGETPNAQEAQDGLAALNAMMDSWRTERLKVYTVDLIGPFNLAAGTASYTIGSGATFNTARPLRLEGGYVRDGEEDFDFRVTTDRREYDTIGDKDTTSDYPELCFYEETFPLGRLWIWPTPVRVLPIYLRSWATLQAFANLTTDLALPPGYQMAIEYNLPELLAGEYGKEVPPSVRSVARKALRGLRQQNAEPGVLQIDMSRGGGRSDIYAGE